MKSRIEINGGLYAYLAKFGTGAKFGKSYMINQARTIQ